MKHYLTPFLRRGLTAAAFLCLNSAPLRAEFITGQSADLTLGKVPPPRIMASPAGIAIDPVSGKIFVCDEQRHRVLRFTTGTALQNGEAEAVLGQPDFNSNMTAASAASVWSPRGLTVDGAGRLWVADTAHHRVLRFDNAASLPNGASASGVLGQPNFTSSVAGWAENQMAQPSAVAVDSGGRLWVAELSNRRVLRFDNAASRPNGANASGVLGQTAFGVAAVGNSADRMNSPRALAVEEQNGVTVRLWVADAGNSRVTGFSSPATLPNGAPADRLLGQSAWNVVIDLAACDGMRSPHGLAMDPNGNLWVADFLANRVLLFNNAAAKPIGGEADLVLGQSTYDTSQPGSGAGGLHSPKGLALQGGRLWICDSENQRLIRHENATAKGNGNDADGVAGQWSLDATPLFGSVTDVAVDPVSGKLFVADSVMNRVLRFPSAKAMQSGEQPEAVLGQPNFTSTGAATAANRMHSPSGLAFGPGGQLWVSDIYNNRVLRFDNAAILPTGASASHVLGQTGFNTSTAATTATGLNNPFKLVVDWGYNLAFEKVARRLWVCDSGNGRVLRYDQPLTLSNGAAAAVVLGQQNFTTKASAISASSMLNPVGIAISSNDVMWVTDYGRGRVLRFDAASQKSNGAPANGVLLQSDFTSQTSSMQPNGLSLSPQGRLFIVTSLHDAVIWFDNASTKPNGAAWDGHIGIWDESGDGFNRLDFPISCFLDSTTGRLWVGDAGNERVLRFTPSLESRVTHAAFNAQNRFALHISGRALEKFEIRASTDLMDWNTVETSLTVSNVSPWQSLIWTAPAPPDGPKKFYRLQVP